MLDKCARKIKDITHKATAAVARAFPGARAYVGEPFNDAAAKMNRRTAQQVSQVCTGKIIAQLGYKMAGVERVCEAYSSQACPACGCRRKCRRVYRCRNPRCGLVAPRDVVGSANIRGIGLNGQLLPGQPMPSTIVFVRPLRKYRGGGQPPPRSSGGTPASSSVLMQFDTRSPVARGGEVHLLLRFEARGDRERQRVLANRAERAPGRAKGRERHRAHGGSGGELRATRGERNVGHPLVPVRGIVAVVVRHHRENVALLLHNRETGPLFGLFNGAVAVLSWFA